MDIYTMKQLRNEHRKSDGKLTLKAFAETLNAAGVIKRAHQAASKGRSVEKKERTRAASSARRTKKTKDNKPAVKA